MPTATAIVLSPEQERILEAIVAFVKDKSPQLRIGGFAGTGKTTLVAQVVRTLREKNPKIRIGFCCFTGKAASVLREKLTAAEVVTEQDYVGTIHGLMYKPLIKGGEILGWKRVDAIDAELLIVDEASMVGEQICKDLLHYKIPILFVGDHGQLPPVGGRFNLMERPDHALTTIHRQAAGNPIIQLSVMAREEGHIPLGKWPDTGNGGAEKIASTAMDLIGRMQVDWMRGALFLCGRNKTRNFMNENIRRILGYTKHAPLVGETVICLKNNREVGIFNGMQGTIKKIKSADQHFYAADIIMADGTFYSGCIIKDQFGAQETIREMKGWDPMDIRDLFDFGYCLTVHKAQGSESDNVVLLEERFSQMNDDDWRRWLYTGVTRARKHLLIVSQK